jgi:hypothetical protein
MRQNERATDAAVRETMFTELRMEHGTVTTGVASGSWQQEVGGMSKHEDSVAPVFSMRVKPAPVVDHESVLVSDLARAVTGMLKASRGGVGEMMSAAQRILDVLMERGADWLDTLQVSSIVEDLYAMLGIASTGALFELDERVDDVEMKMDSVARQRTREELMLLQQRLGELEIVVRARHGEHPETVELDTLLGRLNNLEARIDRLPWPDARR